MPVTNAASHAQVAVEVAPPFRLDLTTAVLRRLSTNIVDRVDDDGVYRRLLGDAGAPAVLRVEQRAPDRLVVRLDGAGASRYEAREIAARVLGIAADVTAFRERSAAVPWLHVLAQRARGVRPPRYPTLWEAAVNAIVFQQVSIHAAAAILRRTIERLVPAHDADGVTLYAFPSPATLLSADPAALRAGGLSVNKVVALRAVARAIDAGELDEALLEVLPTTELCTALTAHKGIGPWTAAVIALRGFGRLDIFPMNDSGATRSLRELSGDPSVHAEPILAILGDQRGMLYYHLLIGRLAARGDLVLERDEAVATRAGL